ncbi:Proteophosphoglycan ppg4 [Rhodotorula toruloides ATCC 204091]|uniref:Proteophosphoglycan ppg4 n=1 Tax=Rhodotorula toruloides TaxID=5286 RepID=A0A0K3CHD8_RHOTO|nr:Proteophosphoglycan ppg4 [Rhodotorula toruloides ATCC 204091]KAK4332450.1 Proteophosphoglycan ppg4 [Rhodotorula toruloides]PRQ72730.1 Proteophosphoglycan ppg4 [Rhodotorula toruloides]
MSLVLPKPARQSSSDQHARREMQAQAGGSMGQGPAGAAESRRANGKGVNRRKGKGKGRMMMIKIFYALNSPRFPSSSAPTPSTSSHLLPASTPSSDFLSVLDPSLAPSPSSQSPAPPTPAAPSPSETNYSCMARLSAPVWVQVIGGSSGARRADSAEVQQQQFGRVTLKTCLSAICISRPELVIDSTKDFSVSAVDPYESSHRRQPPSGPSTSSTSFDSSNDSSSARPGEGLVEGKGMLSWTLAEKKEGTTMVVGRIVGSVEDRRSKRRKGEDGGFAMEMSEGESDADEPEETLEVWLQLTERDAFTQGQFLDCLRSYHNPVQHLQSEMSDFASSPPKRRESALFASTSSSLPPARPAPAAPVPSGDPIKRKRPRETPSLPIPPVAASVPPAPFATGASSPASFLPPPPAALATNDANLAGLQDPRTLALLGQILPSLTAAGADASGLLTALTQQHQQSQQQSQQEALLPAIQTLAKFCGINLPPQQQQVMPTEPLLTSTAADASSHWQSDLPRPPTGAPPTSTATATTSRKPKSGSTSSSSNREHFAAIDLTSLSASHAQAVGKQNPRDPQSGCANCKRRKSTTWREGKGPDGKLMSVCNACGTFYNKNGYHRTKQPAGSTASATSPPLSTSALPSTSTKTAGRPLQGRLTATCEADLVKRKSKKQKTGSSSTNQAGLIPPLSPSKQIGPRSPALNFSFSPSRAGGRSAGAAFAGIVSSPGKSPRMRYRQANGTAATSPVRGPSRPSKGDGAMYNSDGEDSASNPFAFGGLFSLTNRSPSPTRAELPRPPRNSGGKGQAGMPSYLLTASPGTALDRVLSETNIGSIGGIVNEQAGQAESMQLDQASTVPDEFNFFLQPGSPTLGKENARPNAAGKVKTATTSTDAPTTDVDSFESVLSSLRRNFDARLSSNALTAPSSPAPSSPCVLPRTSTATPGSKGKAPQSCGRPPPSILDSFIDGLVPAFALDSNAGGGAVMGTGRTPASDSDAWSPDNAAQRDEDQTVTLDSFAASKSLGQHDLPQDQASRTTRPSHAPTSSFDFSNGGPSKTANRRAAFIPAHLLAPSDATEFDFGSLPPSSPPLLPSEAFPTPSDFDGITPSADGGDADDRESRQQQGAGTLTIEAVAETVAREPNVDTRNAMISLLQSLGASSTGSEQVQLPGVGADTVQLDRDTVNKLLSLISASSQDGSTAGPVSQAASSAAPGAAADSYTMQDESTDYSKLDLFGTLDAGSSAMAGAPPIEEGQSGQMQDLFRDLFDRF